jgi:uncharacterized membrane protein (UPF0127 family)
MFSALVFAVAAAIPTPQPPLPVTIVEAPNARLALQTASTEPERERGLMGVTSLRPHTGMLFVFDSDGPISFWMKDTLISLDMIFVAGDGTVRTVFARVPVVSLATPDNAIPLESGNGRYVIELPAGDAERDGIVPGVRLRFARTP